jgi:hypothetical protein
MVAHKVTNMVEKDFPTQGELAVNLDAGCPIGWHGLLPLVAPVYPAALLT